MEPRRPFDPLRPLEPLPSPFRPPGHAGVGDGEVARLLKEIIDRLATIESRLKSIEDTLKARK